MNHEKLSDTLSWNTGVSVGVVISILGGLFYISTWMAKVDAKLESLETMVNEGTSWTASDMAIWATHLQELNDDIRVPAIVPKD